MSEWAKPFDFPNTSPAITDKKLGNPIIVHTSIVESLKSITTDDIARVNQIVVHPEMIAFINKQDVKFLTGLCVFIETGKMNAQMKKFSEGMHAVYTSMVAEPKARKPVWHGGEPIQIGGVWYSFIATVFTSIKVLQCVGIVFYLTGGVDAEQDAAQCSKYIARDQADLLDVQSMKDQTIALKKRNQKDKQAQKNAEDHEKTAKKKAEARDKKAQQKEEEANEKTIKHIEDLNRASNELNSEKKEQANIIKQETIREEKLSQKKKRKPSS